MIALAKDGFPPELCDRPCKIVKALYGLPCAGASFRAYLTKHLRDLGYVSCKADPDVHMRVETKEDGTEYWAYLVAYVDDILCCGMNPRNQLQAIERRFTLKDGTIEEPTLYLGADIEKFEVPGSSNTAWAMSSTKYTAKAIETVEQELATSKYGYKYLPSTGIKTPLSGDYRPEIDPTQELDHQQQNYYQGLIGVLRWICELGRLDIIMPCSLMSRYLAQAREGHLNQIFHMFGYLKCHKRSKLVFDSDMPYVDESSFTKCDWAEFYPDAKETMPPDMPKPRGKPIIMSCFVDADHAGCKATRRSHTGIIIFINKAPVIWFSKRQTTVETSTFGSEIVALRIAVELVEGLRYKLRMMGIPIQGSTNMYCDNEGVVKNTTRPESPCKKKHNSVAYHKARESIAAGTIRIAKESGKTNIADLFTKLMGGQTFTNMVQRCMW